MSKSKSKPGKKSGARINQTMVAKPLNMRNLTDHELPARAALLALESGYYDMTHLENLYSLGDMCGRMATEHYIEIHADTTMALCEHIRANKKCGNWELVSMRASSGVLLEWLNKQSNADILKSSTMAIKELS